MTNESTDPHKDEALGAVLGMIETYGTKSDEGTSVFDAHVSDSMQDWKFYTYVTEYRLYGVLPDDVSVVQHVGYRGIPTGLVMLQRDGSKRYCATRLEAKIRTLQMLLERKEAITRQYDALKAEIDTEIAEEASL
ncbi:hypothetical protein UFOVP898_71 [uncultured Caudovirales phage]|uniref:Uncharacterized protein n=1 Tax=uncultured Caudovirales phage TaxID=2100421 RepID=A0A6J5PCW9_9CAUD|nr:hypothetical protein UFOVP898_71 [uncultured Caudovirales phage]CAB4176806.1 hypothetical protein UFOVP985_62 [uncultured Caudovirales phage]CAB4181856.1 hypothetical protein UFOVP1073_69 [uncultured Caudovirales phage]CAB4197825.1 hypothetical protein UFOVP1308_34 [uncultured Caudovirales phage]CAB4210644.1 hypothetical protein UFOVP1423_35 [uncultured Caudovirales phage]